MKIANPISAGSADQLRFKTLSALTAVIGGISPQTAERMRVGNEIEKALRKVAHDCLGIDWQFVYNELGIKLDPRFDLSETAGIRKIPMMPQVTVDLTIRCLKANGCRVSLPSNEHIDSIKNDVSVPVDTYLAVVHENLPIKNKQSRLATKKESLVEPTLNEWLLFQLGYVLCSGEPWGYRAFVRCGSSEIVLGNDVCNPCVNRSPLPEGTEYPSITIVCQTENTEWEYLYTRAVTRTALAS